MTRGVAGRGVVEEERSAREGREEARFVGCTADVGGDLKGGEGDRSDRSDACLARKGDCRAERGASSPGEEAGAGGEKEADGTERRQRWMSKRSRALFRPG